MEMNSLNKSVICQKQFIQIFFLIISGILLFPSCKENSNQKHYKIGFSQCTGGDEWRRSMLLEMQRELFFHPDLELVYKDAVNSTQTQIKQINDLMKEDIDLLIISPNESAPLAPVVQEIFRKGIPVIVLDRKINTDAYSTFIGANNIEIGKAVGNFVAKKLKGKGKVVEVLGLESSSPAQERHKAFSDVLKYYPEINVIKELQGQWEKDTARKVAAQNIRALQEADLVFAHNDVMVKGIYEVCHKNSQNKNILFVGIDGLAGPHNGLQMLEDKMLTATFLYPTGGEEAIKVASQILAGKAAQREYKLNSIQIDSSNVKGIKAQSDKLLNQQEDIQKLNTEIDTLENTFSSERNKLYFTIACLFLTLSISAWAFYLVKEKQAANHQLALQNEQITLQKDAIENISEKAKQATEDKLRFYSYISHEFKTPLSLIISPTDELLTLKAISQKDLKSNLQLVQKNAYRLLRLVDQLLDLRKTDAGKLLLQAAEQDLVMFVREIVKDFQNKAIKNAIDLQFFSQENDLKVWFDAEKLDKVIFNLLSNAFKYTPKGGFIHVQLKVKQNNVFIEVKDNGEGMSEKEKNQAFDLFYSGSKHYSLGTGLGLALSKEFVNLHQGDIEVSSQKGEGTTFTILLPLGDQHLTENEKIDQAPVISPSVHQFTEEDKPDSTLNGSQESEYGTILVIEDNTDLQLFLVEKLRKEFNIIASKSAEEGWDKIIENIPDLIISDVMLPGIGGFEITNRIKTDFRTSHIPVILLTAKGHIDDQIEGIKAGADVYLTKPFNTTYLIETIKTLFNNRTRVQRRFSSEFLFKNENKSEKKFLNELTAIIEKHIADSTFSVERLSQEMGMSRVQLYRKVQALLQMNVNDYITEVRLNKAKALLRDTDKSMADIAFEAGFNSPAYFTTLFKQKNNQTPSEYRKNKGGTIFKN